MVSERWRQAVLGNLECVVPTGRGVARSCPGLHVITRCMSAIPGGSPPAGKLDGASIRRRRCEVCVGGSRWKPRVCGSQPLHWHPWHSLRDASKNAHKPPRGSRGLDLLQRFDSSGLVCQRLFPTGMALRPSWAVAGLPFRAGVATSLRLLAARKYPGVRRLDIRRGFYSLFCLSANEYVQYV